MNWDSYFLEIARAVSLKSKDPSTRVSAVLVGPNNVILSVGYNGFGHGVDDSPERYTDRELKYSMVCHAEINALLFGPRSEAKNRTIYTYPFPPCSNCAGYICNSNIWRVVSLSDDYYNHRWRTSFDRAEIQYKEAGIKLDLIYSITEDMITIVNPANYTIPALAQEWSKLR